MNEKKMSRSLVLDTTTFKTSRISFNQSKMGNDSFHIEILYKQAPFMIQFPPCTIMSITPTDNKCDMTMSFDVDDNFGYYKFLQIFDYHISEHLQKKGVENYTPGHTEATVVDSGFKKTKVIVKVKTTGNTTYYDKEKRKIHHYEFNVGDVVIPLVTTKGVFMDSSGANQRWTAKQVLKLN